MGIDSKTLLKNAKKFGFKGVDADVLPALNHALQAFVFNTLRKIVKKNKIQSGGLVMASEYYGVDSGAFYDPSEMPYDYNGKVMDMPYDGIARPSLHINDPTGVLAMTGGGVKFLITLKGVKWMIGKFEEEENLKVDKKYNFSQLFYQIPN